MAGVVCGESELGFGVWGLGFRAWEVYDWDAQQDLDLASTCTCAYACGHSGGQQRIHTWTLRIFDMGVTAATSSLWVIGTCHGGVETD